MQQDQLIIGIDLGTTNSVVAVMEGEEPVVIPNQEGANKTPSVVAFLDDNECIVGEIARRQAATNPARTISSTKRLIGCEFADIEDQLDLFPFEVVEQDGKVLLDVDGLGYSPQQVSALILQKLKESAESYLGMNVKQAVITVPANFDDSQRNATLEAAELAGLEVLRLINEPTAAALAYGIGKTASQDDETIAIYDFGGGTFDVTILEVSEKTFEVLTSTGDAHLGGDDLDNAIVDLIIDEFHEEKGVDLTEDPVTLRRLKEQAEKAKIELSTATQSIIALPFIAYKDGQPIHLERSITRDEFEGLIEPFVNRAIRCCRRALEDAGLQKRDVDKVILVGGTTRIPIVEDSVEDFFGIGAFKGINPDEVVALGAATQAGVFSGNIEEVTLIDVAPHSLGIEVKDGKFSTIIEKNATIPIKAAKNFTTTEDNQEFVNIHILQGEEPEAAQNRSLGKFILTDIPAQTKGKARIRVTFFVNADGVMEISAEELGSGSAQSLTIIHSELDEKEKKSRRKAKKRRDRSDRRGRKSRYSMDATGGGQQLKRKKRGMPSGDSSSLSTRTRPRRADSSVVERSPENFAVVGDADPGSAPTSRIGGKKLDTDAPIKGLELGKEKGPVNPPIPGEPYPAPKRYGNASPSNMAEGPAGADLKAAADSQTNIPEESIPLPPEFPPTHDDRTEEFVSEVSKDETQLGIDPVKAREMEEAIPSIPDSDFEKPSNYPAGEIDEDIDWPGIVDSALDLAQEKDQSPDSFDLYKKSIKILYEEPWVSDDRFFVKRARVILSGICGQIEEALDEISDLRLMYGHGQTEKVSQLFSYLMELTDNAPNVRRERARFFEMCEDFEAASEDIERAAKSDQQPEDLKELERLYRVRSDKNKDAAAKFKLVKLFLKSNRVDDAIELLQDLQNHQAYETRALKILGLCHWQKNLHFLAWQKFKHLNPTDELNDILYRLANDMESTGQFNNALSVYTHLQENSPGYLDVAKKVEELRGKLKKQQEETEQNKAAILSDSRFTIIEEINRGSMGIIYKAQDKTLDEQVALKVLNDYLTVDPSAVERFKREARAAKKLSHPYIVRIHDMFETGNKRFISMEYIEGHDLKRLLAERTSFSFDQLIYYLLQICDALSYAHRLNIVHRDIKPANVMITNENSVKVTDFGIAKILKSEDSTKSGTAVIGTPLYMAPEQITGEGVDARTDIYSLGIMMYELVSGHPPFYLGNIEYHHIHTAPPPLPDTVPDPLRSVIMKCMEKEPGNRFQSINELYKAIQGD